MSFQSFLTPFKSKINSLLSSKPIVYKAKPQMHTDPAVRARTKATGIAMSSAYKATKNYGRIKGY